MIHHWNTLFNHCFQLAYTVVGTFKAASGPRKFFACFFIEFFVYPTCRFSLFFSRNSARRCRHRVDICGTIVQTLSIVKVYRHFIILTVYSSPTSNSSNFAFIKPYSAISTLYRQLSGRDISVYCPHRHFEQFCSRFSTCFVHFLKISHCLQTLHRQQVDIVDSHGNQIVYLCLLVSTYVYLLSMGTPNKGETMRYLLL